MLKYLLHIMKFDNRKLAGALLLFGSVQFLLGLHACTLTGIGAMGVGLFPETAGAIHGVVSLIAFLFGGLSAITSYKLLKPPFSYSAVLLGALSLVALALFGSGIYLGLGWGGMERMIVYPTLLWAVGFSGHLMSYSGDSAKATG
jgi:hypothetical membrane protein